jgi:hypothetical protein
VKVIENSLFLNKHTIMVLSFSKVESDRGNGINLPQLDETNYFKVKYNFLFCIIIYVIEVFEFQEINFGRNTVEYMAAYY